MWMLRFERLLPLMCGKISRYEGGEEKMEIIILTLYFLRRFPFSFVLISSYYGLLRHSISNIWRSVSASEFHASLTQPFRSHPTPLHRQRQTYRVSSVCLHIFIFKRIFCKNIPKREKLKMKIVQENTLMNWKWFKYCMGNLLLKFLIIFILLFFLFSFYFWVSVSVLEQKWNEKRKKKKKNTKKGANC